MVRFVNISVCKNTFERVCCFCLLLLTCKENNWYNYFCETKKVRKSKPVGLTKVLFNFYLIFLLIYGYRRIRHHRKCSNITCYCTIGILWTCSHIHGMPLYLQLCHSSFVRTLSIYVMTLLWDTHCYCFQTPKCEVPSLKYFP